MKAARVRPSVRDAFDERARDLPDTTATRNAHAEHARHRSSHDLSWSPRRARDSVVDNMLLSLDQLGDSPAMPSRPGITSRALFQEEDEEDQYGNTVEVVEDHPDADARRYAPAQGRPPGHTHASSHSSGYSASGDLVSPPPRRGHRSNSSSGFQTSLGRIDSTRAARQDNSGPAGTGPRQENVPAPILPEPNRTPPRPILHRRGSSSPDIAQALDSAPWQRKLNRRSASFDHSFGHSARPGDLPPLITAADRSFFYDEIEAAPTPTVPAGPRYGQSNLQASPFRPGSSFATPKQNMHRRGSLRAPLSLFARGEKDRSASHLAPKPSMRGFHTRDDSGDATRLGPSRADPGNPPDVRIPSSTSHNTPSSTGKDRERPGFFRRVFGSRNTTPMRNDPTDAANKGSLPAGSGRLAVPTPQGSNESRASDVGNTPSPYRALSRERQPLKEQPSQVLNKKSSFFRRRRKSVTEPAPVPAFPPQLEPHPYAKTAPQSRGSTAPTGPPPLSPSSSLRKVMNPYIEDAVPGRRDARNQHSHTGPGAAASSQPGAQFSDGDRVVQRYQMGREAGPRWPEYEQDTIRPGHNPVPPTLERRSTDTGRPRASTGHSRAPSDVHKDLPALPNEPSALDEPEGLYMRPSPTKTSKPPDDLLERPLPKVRQPRGASRADENTRPVLSRISTAPDIRNDSARASGSTLGDYQSATSKIHSPTPDADLSAVALDVAKALSSFEHQKTDDTAAPAIDDSAPAISDSALAIDDPAPSSEDRELAEKLLHGEAENTPKDEIVAYLGTEGAARARLRHAFADLFDWRDASILTALRDFCARVPLRGETQQVDRVLDALARRWCTCNPHHGFQAADVVHTVCYSLLLLNTDLHLADIESKMTRQQFVRNTMPTIRRVVVDAAPDAFEQGRSSMLPPPRSPIVGPADAQGILKSSGGAMDAHDGAEAANQPSDTGADDCGPLVKKPFRGKLGVWEMQVEAVLRNFYQSIRQERLPLHGSGETEAPINSQPSSTSLSAMSNMLRRTNSMLSKAGSETYPARGRLDQRPGIGGSSSRWSSKARSRPRLYPPSMARSRTSFDDGDTGSAISPSGSSLWSSSRFSLGKTQTSMSVNSTVSDRSRRGAGAGDYQQSIGFANALSQAIIREEAAGAGGSADGDGADEAMRAAPLLEDESLELAGAPWAKEGLLKHKRHLEAADRRARDRTWTDCFAVVEKGWMRLFQFQVGSRSLRHKARAVSGRHHPPSSSSGVASSGSAGGGGSGGPVVGGGNWLDNAQPLDQFPLRHTLASALPPPGYSKARPHVWALSLPTGAVHLFHAGTAEIVREFVAAANYWSARLSKEPLVGAVSNVEYGWSERIINLALLAGDGRPPSTVPPLPSNASVNSGVPRPSLQSSIRSSFDQSVGGGARPRLPGDKVPISDWSPPSQSMLASQLLEVDQLKALTTYVRNVEEELKKHNELRGAILLAVSRARSQPRSLLFLLTCLCFSLLHILCAFLLPALLSLRVLRASLAQVSTYDEES